MAESPEPSGPIARRLADAPSVYLRAAAAQGIDWYPWGGEPFEAARRSGRPILLDIGASWCHWCHVMDETTYTDPEVGRLLRQHFVAVKVDRDEHPEVDRRYQRQVGALTGEGGWPLTGFLNADGELFLGGTYFPPDDGHGRPGLRRVLKEVARLWKEEPERIRQNAEAIQGSLRRMRDRRAPVAPDLVRFVDGVRTELDSGYDPVNAGFGGAPKFPHPTAIAFQLWDAFANGNATTAERARETLLRMAEGGLYDQVGGGFHRVLRGRGLAHPALREDGGRQRGAAPRVRPGPRAVRRAAVRGGRSWHPRLDSGGPGRSGRRLGGEPGRGQRSGGRRGLLHVDEARAEERSRRRRVPTRRTGVRRRHRGPDAPRPRAQRPVPPSSGGRGGGGTFPAQDPGRGRYGARSRPCGRYAPNGRPPRSTPPSTPASTGGSSERSRGPAPRWTRSPR